MVKLFSSKLYMYTHVEYFVSLSFVCPVDVTIPWLHFGIGDECATVCSTDHLILHWRLLDYLRGSVCTTR